MEGSQAIKQWLRLAMKYFQKKETEAMNRANESGTSIEAAQSWRRVTIPLATTYLVKSLFWKNIQGGIKRKGEIEHWRKVFYELDEFLKFYCATHNKWPRIVSDDSALVTFVSPYGFINASVNEESFAAVNDYMNFNQLSKLFFDCSVEGVDVKQFLVFVLERRDVEINQHRFILFKVLFPEASSHRKQVLMNGVSLKGSTGWVPGKSLTQAYCRCPAVSFVSNEDEANPFVYIFKPHQIRNGVLQWRVAGNLNQLEENAFPLPNNFTVWEGDIQNLQIENGELVDFDLMFKQTGGWMHVRVTRFYGIDKRTVRKPFNYEVVYLDGSREKQDILFDLTKYSVEVNAALSSWCIITES